MKGSQCGPKKRAWLSEQRPQRWLQCVRPCQWSQQWWQTANTTEIVPTPTPVKKPPHAMQVKELDGGVQDLFHFSLTLNAYTMPIIPIVACNCSTDDRISVLLPTIVFILTFLLLSIQNALAN